MERYETPEMEVIVFGKDDVIVTSNDAEGPQTGKAIDSIVDIFRV